MSRNVEYSKWHYYTSYTPLLFGEFAYFSGAQTDSQVPTKTACALEGGGRLGLNYWCHRKMYPFII